MYSYLYPYLHWAFLGILWEKMAEAAAPIVPQCQNEYDTSNFNGNKHYDEKEILNPFFIKVQNSNQEVPLPCFSSFDLF